MEEELEKELKQLDSEAEALEATANLKIKNEIHRVRASILGALYMLNEEFDEEYVKETLPILRQRVYEVSRIALKQSGEFVKQAIDVQDVEVHDTIPSPPDEHIPDVQFFHAQMNQLALRYRHIFELMETMTYRTAVAILKETVGKERAEREIDNFFFANRHHFTKK